MLERSLVKQKQILAMRNEWVRGAGTATDKLRAEETAYKIMSTACPEQLYPVLIQRNNAELVAAYLMQKIGDHAWRFLITGENWQILRAKKSATLIRIPAELFEAFKHSVLLQGTLMASIETLKNASLRIGRENGRKNLHAGKSRPAAKKQPGVCKSRASRIKAKS